MASRPEDQSPLNPIEEAIVRALTAAIVRELRAETTSSRGPSGGRDAEAPEPQS